MLPIETALNAARANQIVAQAPVAQPQQQTQQPQGSSNQPQSSEQAAAAFIEAVLSENTQQQAPVVNQAAQAQTQPSMITPQQLKALQPPPQPDFAPDTDVIISILRSVLGNAI